MDNRLKFYRLDAKLSLRALAEKTGASNSYLSQLENHRANNPTLSLARRLSAALGLSIDELFPAPKPCATCAWQDAGDSEPCPDRLWDIANNQKEPVANEVEA